MLPRFTMVWPEIYSPAAFLEHYKAPLESSKALCGASEFSRSSGKTLRDLQRRLRVFSSRFEDSPNASSCFKVPSQLWKSRQGTAKRLRKIQRLFAVPRRAFSVPKRGSGVAGGALECSKEALVEGMVSIPAKEAGFSDAEASRSLRLVGDPPQLVKSSPHEASRSPRLVDDPPRLVKSSPREASRSPWLVDDSPRLVKSPHRKAGRSPRLVDDSPRLVESSPHEASRSPRLVDDPPRLRDGRAQESVPPPRSFSR
jgi:hypothetical protein